MDSSIPSTLVVPSLPSSSSTAIAARSWAYQSAGIFSGTHTCFYKHEFFFFGCCTVLPLFISASILLPLASMLFFTCRLAMASFSVSDWQSWERRQF